MGNEKNLHKLSINSDRSDFELFFTMINFILPVQEMRETKHMDGTMNHFGHLHI
jgi:hypothetical protein